jgi:hypothetical protein
MAYRDFLIVPTLQRGNDQMPSGGRITAPLLILPKAWEAGLQTICREPAANPVDGVCLILQGV